MQTLPTPVSPTKALTMADVANQNGTQANKSSIDNAKASFQAELNRQVRAKQGQAQVKQDKGAESNKSSAQSKSSVKDRSEIDKSAVSSTEGSNNNQINDSFLTDLNKQLDAARDLSSKVVLDDVRTVTEANSPAIADLISALGIPPGQGLQNNLNSLSASVTLESGDAQLAADTTLLQKGLIPALNPNAHNQSDPKQAGVALAEDGITKQQDKAVVDVSADIAQPKTQLNAEESAFNKALANVTGKELAAKDVAATNVTQVPTASVNPVQNNSSLASQQLASSNMINVYPGKSGWDQAISQKVVWMVGAGQQSATLTLNPPDLGPLKVVINVHNDQADTTFISDNDEVRKALESGMSHLRDKMNESGIQLGQANVSTSQQSQQEFQQAAQDRVFQNIKGQANTEQIESSAQSKVTVRVSDGLVDTFA